MRAVSDRKWKAKHDKDRPYQNKRGNDRHLSRVCWSHLLLDTCYQPNLRVTESPPVSTCRKKTAAARESGDVKLFGGGAG